MSIVICVNASVHHHRAHSRVRTVALGAIIVVAGGLVLPGIASAGSDFYVTVKNDLNNRTEPSFPKVALQNRGDFKCWWNEDLDQGPNALAAAPGESKKLRTEVQQSLAPCLTDFLGYRDVEVVIKETAAAEWVAIEGQGGFRLRFGRGSDFGSKAPSDCDPAATGKNCMSIMGFPGTWATRPGGVGLVCLVLDRFDQNEKNSRQQVSNAVISVRDDLKCNVPRASVYWPRTNGTPVGTGFPKMGPTERRAKVQAEAGKASALMPMVANVMSGARIICAWGIRDEPGKPTNVPTQCNDAASDSGKYQLNDLTIPEALPPDGRPPNFKVLSELVTGDPFVLVAKSSQTQAPDAGEGQVTVQAQTSWGHQESSQDSKSLQWGAKGSYGVEWKWKTSMMFAEAESTVKTSVEASITGTRGSQTGFQSTTTKQVSQSFQAKAPAGATTSLRVYKTSLNNDYTYRADLWFGTDGKGEEVGNPAAVALGMTPSSRQECLALTIGDATVTGSFMEFGKRRFDIGDLGPRGTASASELAFYDSLDSFYVGERRCPGYPRGFASAAGMKGDGVGSFSSDGEEQVRVLDANGKPAFTADGSPRFMITQAPGLTACVFVARSAGGCASAGQRHPASGRSRSVRRIDAGRKRHRAEPGRHGCAAGWRRRARRHRRFRADRARGGRRCREHRWWGIEHRRPVTGRRPHHRRSGGRLSERWGGGRRHQWRQRQFLAEGRPRQRRNHPARWRWQHLGRCGRRPHPYHLSHRRNHGWPWRRPLRGGRTRHGRGVRRRPGG